MPVAARLQGARIEPGIMRALGWSTRPAGHGNRRFSAGHRLCAPSNAAALSTRCVGEADVCLARPAGCTTAHMRAAGKAPRTEPAARRGPVGTPRRPYGACGSTAFIAPDAARHRRPFALGRRARFMPAPRSLPKQPPAAAAGYSPPACRQRRTRSKSRPQTGPRPSPPSFPRWKN